MAKNENNKYPDIYRYPTGEVFYLPHTDRTKEFPLSEDSWGYPREWKERPKSLIVFTDWDEESVHYANGSSRHEVVSIRAFGPVNDVDVKRMLESKFSDANVLKYGDSEYRYNAETGRRDYENTIEHAAVSDEVLNRFRFEEQEDIIPGDPDARSWRKRRDWGKPNGKFKNKDGEEWTREEFGDIRLKKFSSYGGALPLYMYSESKEFANHVDRRLAKLVKTFEGAGGDVYHKQLGEEYAALRLAQKHAKGYKKLLRKAIDREHAVLNAKATDAPTVPNMVDELGGNPLKFFPHQAQALAALANTDTGLVDADMGAGKTLISLADALVQLKQGRASKVAIVMPGHVLAQQKAEIRRFTGNTVNVIIVNTQTIKKVGNLAEMQKLIKGAPINTIILVAYNWLSRDRTKQEHTGENYYPNADMLLKAGVDSMSLDESHNIRNANSHTSQACMQMAPHLRVKRCMTGTLIPNMPGDVYMQATFLDPNILGTWEDFLDTYADDYSRGGKVNSWRASAMKDLRKRLKSKGMLSIRRSNWLYLMPPFEKSFHKVELTSTQKKLYDNILLDIINDIKNDPHLASALAEMEASTDDDDGMEFGALLAKFGPLDKFASNPMTHRLGADLPGDEKLGPKIKKVDELLTKHFAMDDPGKVIVFTQYKAVAHHIAEHSTHSSKMLYYDAGHKGNLARFKTDDHVQVLVAVDVSLREGHNLQMANRIIRLDMPWSPGPVEQSYARIFRLKQKRKVYLDVIATAGTAEMVKMARLISKRHTARKLISDFEDPTNLEVISMNVGNMTSFNKWEQLEPYIAREDEIDNHERKEGDVAEEKQGSEMLPLNDKKAIGNKVIDVPILASEPPENHADFHILSYDGDWYLAASESKDTSKLTKFGWEHTPSYWERRLTSKSEAKKVLKAIQAADIIITNIKDVTKFIGGSKVLTAGALRMAAVGGKGMRVVVHSYQVDGYPAIAIDAIEEGHELHLALEKLKFAQVGTSYWYGLGKAKSLSNMKKALNAVHAKARFDIDNWEEFVKMVHRAWGMDLNQMYGYEPIAEMLSEYTFEIGETWNRKDMNGCLYDLKQSGGEALENHLDTRKGVARITVKIENPKQFLTQFKKTDTYPYVIEVQRKRVEELAEAG